MARKSWWIPLLTVIVTGGAGLAWMATRTYKDAPPMAEFHGPGGERLFGRREILDGQGVFLRNALMEHGSFFGDGAGRGPDFTADALNRRARSLTASFQSERRARGLEVDADAVALQVHRAISANTYDKATEQVTLTAADVAAFEEYAEHVTEYFSRTDGGGITPHALISDRQELRDLAAFFFWGGWVCGAQRPGHEYSYTHNWPYDPLAGTKATAPTLFWSVMGSLALIFGLGVVLYAYGRAGSSAGWDASREASLLTTEQVTVPSPTGTQRATYPFFAVAGILFLIQVLMGALVAHDFLGATEFFGVDFRSLVPATVLRSWHVALSLFWISACWMGASIFLLPRLSGSEPPRQLLYVRVLFWLIVTVVVGSVAGIVLGPLGLLGDQWRFLGHQGWEFVEFGRFWQGLLFVAIGVWLFVLWRGALPAIRRMGPFSLPWMLVFTVGSVLVLFLSGFVSGPETNFVIADFWRWAVIHMWVEGFFEVFTTVIVALFLVFMGLVTRERAVRACYIATLLFLGSGLLGIAHNFYWNAKPVSMLALGSVFSTLQVVPLILLTLDAWKFRRLPQQAMMRQNGGSIRSFGQDAAFLFLIGVNFWNFLGAGVFGFIINLPIVNYYEHGTYLTVNHGHAALMGVYGNLALAAILYCCRHLVPAERWSGGILRSSFWAINIGLMLMLLLDTLPVGFIQLEQVLSGGYASARSPEFIGGESFQTLTWMRAVGGWIFTFGGVVPVAWFLVTRWGSLKPASRSGHIDIVLEDEAEPGAPA